MSFFFFIACGWTNEPGTGTGLLGTGTGLLGTGMGLPGTSMGLPGWSTLDVKGVSRVCTRRKFFYFAIFLIKKA